MRLTFDKNPITLLFCIIWSIIAYFFIIFDVNNLFRIILSIPIIIFIPGHMLICALFPTKKTDKGIDFTERIALSLGLSLAIVPIFGIILNYTRWGFELGPIILTLEVFILIIGSIAVFRWYQTPPSNRFTITINIALPKHENRFDKTLTGILVMTVIIALILVVYAAITPKEIEKFTEFYYTASGGIGNDYPRDIIAGENTSIIIGIANHEYKTINYTVEVWLVNQTTIYNQTLNNNKTVYNNLWFMNKINVTLEHTPINLVENWTRQWEYNYIFNITHLGDFRLVFLLYTHSTPAYSRDTDYIEIADEKINSDHTTAYRDIYLNLKVV
ncbi:MAG: DUF1616 domain-containing protein [Candidatus Thermoplasmatota archaeon]|nr:DUF1616 domain-containing protein [Candidatus Thermoplasmatota archaeon]